MTNEKNYQTADMSKCEYIELMAKAYCVKPKQDNGRCKGFKNRYSGKPSNVCAKCANFEG